jgi:MSHA biogenesis protein MshL
MFLIPNVSSKVASRVTMRIINNIIILTFIAFLTGCSGDKIAKKFDRDIDEVNEFYNSSNGYANYKEILHADYDVDELRENKQCRRADVNVQNVNLAQLAKLLSAIYHININYAYDPNNYKNSTNAAAPDVENASAAGNDFSDNIHLHMQDVCLEDVFKTLTEVYDTGIKQVPYGYLLYPKQLRTETFVVDYHNFSRKGKSSIAIVNSQLKSSNKNDAGISSTDSYSSISAESEDNFWNSIAKTIRSILSTDKERKLSQNAENSAQNNSPEDFYVYKESGLIVVTAYPKQLKYIRDFIAKVNRHSTQQVLIEAKILEVELNDEFSNGVEWEAIKAKLNFTSLTSLNQTIGSVHSLHKTVSLNSSNDFSGGFSAILEKNGKFESVLKALSTQGKISVMSSPRVLALNNQRALIKSGQDEYFVTNVSNFTFSSTNTNNAPVGKSGFDLEPFFSGIALDTTPNILNSSELLLHIHPMISRVENQNKAITIDDKGTTIPVAMIQSREADTVVRAQSGDIIILGGMTQNIVKLRSSGAPIDGKTKGLAKLLDFFSSKKYQSKKVELIILLKPTIVKNFDNREDIGTFMLQE